MITSVDNRKVKQIVQYCGKARARDRDGVFVAEGRSLFLEAPAGRLDAVYLSETFTPDPACEAKLAQLAGTEVETVSADAFRKMSDTQTPQGILCVVKQAHYELEEMLRKEAPLLLLLEDLQDPGNLGTILRTAEGAGADGVLLSKGCADPYQPKTVRATMGSIYRTPFCYVQDMAKTLARLHEAGVKSYAAHLKGERFYDAYSYRGGTAFLIGNEGAGLREDTARAADCYLKIPMEGRVESLNAAVASALLLYEAARQRRQAF